MLMTRDEARKYVCPFRCDYCLAEKCMCWREVEVTLRYRELTSSRIKKVEEVTKGYCGVGGELTIR